MVEAITFKEHSYYKFRQILEIYHLYTYNLVVVAECYYSSVIG